MRSDRFDTEGALPRREWDREAQCACPYCSRVVRVRGDFCAVCRSIQQLQREALRARNEHGRRRFSARGQAV